MSVEGKQEGAELAASTGGATALGMEQLIPQEVPAKMEIDAPALTGAPEDLAGPAERKPDAQPPMTMDTEMLVNATGSLEPKIAFHAGEVVVIECPPPAPDAFWLGIAVKNIMEIDDATRALIEQDEQQEDEDGMGGASGGASGERLPRPTLNDKDPRTHVRIRWLARVASFENGDDLYSPTEEDYVKRSKVLCLAHVTLMENDPFTGTRVNQYVVTMAERHRLIRFIANGDENAMEDSEDGDIIDGARVAALVSRATVNNTAFFLVKWSGFENPAMTWEPMILLTQCCPDLVAHFEDAPYKLAIQFPSQQPPAMPVHAMPMDHSSMPTSPATPSDVGTPTSRTPGGSTRGRQSTRGRGRGGAKYKPERSPAEVPPSVTATTTLPPPVAQPIPIPSEPQPPPPPPMTETDTSKGPILFSQLSSMAAQQLTDQVPTKLP